MKYKTGKLAPRIDRRTLKMSTYLTASVSAPPLAYNALTRVYANLEQSDPTVLFPMDGNDRYRDCTYAAKSHAVTVYNGLVGQMDIMGGPDVVAAYLAFTGGQDTGCTELDVLNDWRQNAFIGDKILAYIALNTQDLTAIKQAIWLFGGVYLGFQVQANAETDFDARVPWTPGTLTGGGHAVFAVAYDAQGVTVLTWGNTQAATWAWWNETVDEAYAIIPSKAANSRFCPGFDLAQLQSDLVVVTA
jgi:hypothetical protein